ncbi:MAG TPA: PASTA domain-containing protein, partial [Thermoanaerobaculia bacterium]|nr:PASTA domain-containing protein [Thermoanaerobaculia bacterium]
MTARAFHTQARSVSRRWSKLPPHEGYAIWTSAEFESSAPDFLAQLTASWRLSWQVGVSLKNARLRGPSASRSATRGGRVRFSDGWRRWSLVGSLLLLWLSANTGFGRAANLGAQASAPPARRTLPPSAYQVQPGVGTDVPNLRGQRREEVPRILEAARLRLGTVSVAFSQDPAGQVTAQNPEAGEHVARGTQVNVTISRGPDLVPVPNVIGQPLEAAKQSLAEAGLNIILVGKKESDQPAETVVDQLPRGETRVNRGTRVEVTIAVPAAKVPVPSLVGLTEDAAREKLAGAGLTQGAREERATKDPAGTIVGQDPAAGELVARGSPVSTIVAAAAEIAIVPSLVGRSIPEAEKILLEARLRFGRQQEVKSDEPSGHVLRQRPLPDTHVPPGTPVEVLVSVSAWVEVPDLSGLGNEQARQRLRQSGLVLGAVGQQVSALSVGTVVRQAPGAGGRARPGTRVDVWMASAQVVFPWPAVIAVTVVAGLVAAGVYRTMVRRQRSPRQDKPL